MVIPLNKFFEMQTGQTVDEALINSLAAKVPTYLASDQEETRQKGRKIEATIEKIRALEEEYEGLERVGNILVKTPVTEFQINFGQEQLALEKVHGAAAKNLAMSILDDAAKTNRLEYLTAYLLLLKLKP